MTYEDYYKCKLALEDLLPNKREIDNNTVPELIKDKATEFRYVILGALAELNDMGWEDEQD